VDVRLPYAAYLAVVVVAAGVAVLRGLRRPGVSGTDG
jgi:hypothetical protein